MTTPTITIEGKTYEMPRPKGGLWRKLLEFDKDYGDIFTVDAMEKRCNFLAGVYGGGLSADILLDNLYLDEIAQAYRDVVTYLIGLVSAKLEEVEKNVGEDDKKTL